MSVRERVLPALDATAKRCIDGRLAVCTPPTQSTLRFLRSPRLQDQLPADPDARKSWQWSKAKKWVMHIASRLFNR